MLRKFAILACSVAFASVSLAAQKDYHDQDLKDHNFTQALLNNADFSDANLHGCDFNGASLKKANFKGADLTNTSLIQVDATGADFREVKGIPTCSHSHFDNANMEAFIFTASDCTFKGANLKGCKISGYISGNDFSGANLTGANMRTMVVHTDSNRWKGATYDDDTAWPDGFDPVAAGAVLVKTEEVKPVADTKPAQPATAPPTTQPATAPAAGVAGIAGKYVSEDKSISCELNADGTVVFHEGDQAINGTYKADGSTISMSIQGQEMKIKLEGNALISPQSDKKLIKQ